MYAKDCADVTNSSGSYLGIAEGAAISAVIEWVIHYTKEDLAATGKF